MKHTTVLLLGSNHTESITYLQLATNAIKATVGQVKATSTIYKTEPWGFESKNWFYNCALLVETELTAEELMQKLKQIEVNLGRTQKMLYNADGTRYYTDRTIDCDILSFDQEIITLPDLIVPHKELTNRKFALLPMNDVAALWVHPKKNKTVTQLLNSCRDTSFVAPFEGVAIS